MKLINIFLVFVLLHTAQISAAAPHETPPNRVVSVYVSEDFINEQINLHSKSEMVRNLKINLAPENGEVILTGKIHVPVEEMKAINLDPKLGVYKFQVALKPEATKEGFLILDFPLSQTYFYPENSTDLKNDRVIVPVQMLSLALASVRGYISALSGDFSGFDRRSEKLEALKKNLDHSIARMKNPDAVEELKNQRAALDLQIAAIPIERKQLQGIAKSVEHLIGFTGEKDLNINDQLGARKNALILKIKLAQLTPFLNGIELGGIRILHDKKDGNGEDYFVIDINSALEGTIPPPRVNKPSDRQGMKVAPSAILRINQTIFQSESLVEAEKKQMGSKIRDLDIQLQDDGLHVSGKFHKFFFNVPFETVVDFISTGQDLFELRVREMNVAGLDVEFLAKFVLETIKARLDTMLKGACTFTYLGSEADKSRALQVAVNVKALAPAFADLHLVDVDIREQEFLLKIGH